MRTDVVVRPAAAGDASALGDVHLAARRAAPMPPPVRSDVQVRAWLAGRLERDEVWVAESDGDVVGYARLVGDWLDDLYVHPRCSRSGVGSALMQTVKARRPGGFQLWAFETNAPARHFYARHGLVELERTDGSANEEAAPDIRVAWPGRQPLVFLRRCIDEVDRELGDLLAPRAALTAAIQPLKDTPERDPAREADVVRRIASRARVLDQDDVARIMDAVITASLRAIDP